MQRAARLVLLSFVMTCTWAGTQANDIGPPFANPAMLSSHAGTLPVDLVAASAAYTIEGHQFQGMLYNGQYMPPVWRLRAGDRLL